ncbi:MAG: hypothetical protein H6850_02995 [Alphaproteobacteria bacterium]|nr:MAG: hypothetical protein H6850_02995 [Alphaproteobacteria bacterium]
MLLFALKHQTAEQFVNSHTDTYIVDAVAKHPGQTDVIYSHLDTDRLNQVKKLREELPLKVPELTAEQEKLFESYLTSDPTTRTFPEQFKSITGLETFLILCLSGNVLRDDKVEAWLKQINHPEEIGYLLPFILYLQNNVDKARTKTPTAGLSITTTSNALLLKAAQKLKNLRLFKKLTSVDRGNETILLKQKQKDFLVGSLILELEKKNKDPQTVGVFKLLLLVQLHSETKTDIKNKLPKTAKSDFMQYLQDNWKGFIIGFSQFKVNKPEDWIKNLDLEDAFQT